jgi:surface antigen
LQNSLRRHLSIALIFVGAALVASCTHDDDLQQARTSAHNGPSASVPDVAAIERAMATAPQSRSNSVAWANTTTGSAGVLSYTENTDASGGTCRTFISSRQSLDGGDTLNGRACAEGDGRWRVHSLSER